MPRISAAKYRKMKNSYRPDVARYLSQRTGVISYGELSKQFGINPRSWGDIVGGIAIRTSENRLPILSVIVVNAMTGKPSKDAIQYEELGLISDELIAEEQVKCFAFDWSSTIIGR
ncbi:hypothetical protein MESS2_320005 [Mesorhizobium metallidurans STM 2683]|uniref:Uncharacterized protein n=1 Tax=Mesorhizobium metallidurans STM 2683 TaxID=1297569 RepID=M5EP05_9HYPH|nr:hypothetical protein [Mesorhizobium metallidurans]CCV06479.1 hypothetical protein MESS2_320005 [Mesorhizobium metallidurans STM 2683]